MITENETKNDELSELDDEFESDFDEEEMQRMERENDQFSLWLGGYFLPLLLQICAVAFSFLVGAQISILWPKAMPWLLGAIIGAVAALLTLYAISSWMIAKSRKQRLSHAQSN